MVVVILAGEVLGLIRSGAGVVSLITVVCRKEIALFCEVPFKDTHGVLIGSLS